MSAPLANRALLKAEGQHPRAQQHLLEELTNAVIGPSQSPLGLRPRDDAADHALRTTLASGTLEELAEQWEAWGHGQSWAAMSEAQQKTVLRECAALLRRVL